MKAAKRPETTWQARSALQLLCGASLVSRGGSRVELRGEIASRLWALEMYMFAQEHSPYGS